MIKNITKEQESKIPEYIDKWIRVASQPLNRDNSVRVVKELFGKDKTVLIAESIQNSIDIIKYILNGKEATYSSQLDSQLDSQLYSQLRSQLYSQLGSQLYSQLRSQLYSQLGSQLYSQLGSQLDSQLGDKVEWSSYTTQYWLSWLGYYDYAQYIGVQFDTDKLKRMEEILLAIPSIITLGNILIVIENPIVRWENQMIHSDQKPAIEWKDNTGLYYLDGVNLPKDMWNKIISKKMSFSEIMAIEISDQRTVALKYNPEAIIKENAKLIHKDDRNNELYLIENSEINKITEHPKMYFLKMLCPTGRVFVEGVEPKFAEAHPNATECQAELCGLTKSEYMSMKLES